MKAKEKKSEANYSVNDFIVFKFREIVGFFLAAHISYKFISLYLFFEFVRPQSLFPKLDFVPWTKLFIIGALACTFLDKSIKWVSTPANKWIICFSVWMLISVLFSQYSDIAIKYYMDIFNWVIIYFLIINIVNTKERLYVFVLIYIVTVGKIAVGTSKTWAMRGFSFEGWGLQGPPGFFTNSGELAILMVMLFPLTYYLYVATAPISKKWEKAILALFFICPILTVLGASSRGSQVALFVIMVLMFRKSVFKPKALIAIAVVSFALINLLPEEQKNRFSDSGSDRTSQQRLLYWSRGLEMMEKYPLTGVGLYNFQKYFEVHFSQDMLYEHAQLPHNIFIQVGTDSGVVGLFFYIQMILFCLLNSRPKLYEGDVIMRHIATGMGIGVLGFAVAGQFVTVGYYPFIWIHLAFVVVIRNVTVDRKLPLVNGQTG